MILHRKSCEIVKMIFFTVYYRLKRVQAHYLVMNTAIADLFVGLVSNIILIAGISTCLHNNNYHDLAEMWEIPCHFVGPLSIMFVYASYMTLSCIALDRCLVVIYGARYKIKVTITVIKIEVIISWVLSVLLAFLGPHVFGLTKIIYSFHPPESMCVVVTAELVENDTMHKSGTSEDHTTIRDENFSIMESILSMYLPFIILVTSSVVLLTLLQIRRTGKRSDIVRKSCQTVLLMIGGYLICSTPYAVTALYTQLSPEAYLVFRFLVQLHCMFTPIIYILRDTSFRRAMRNSNRKVSPSNFSYIVTYVRDRSPMY